MSNSAWYTNIWRKKLDELPIQEDAANSWADMQRLLDQNIPIAGNPKAVPTKSLGATIISLLGYIIPAAAMVGGATFAIVHIAKIKTITTHQPKQKTAYNRHHINRKADSLIANDSLDVKNTDSAKTTPDHKTSLSSATIKLQIAQTGINKAGLAETNPNSAKSKQVVVIKRQTLAVRLPRQNLPSLTKSVVQSQTKPLFTQQHFNTMQPLIINNVKDASSGKNTNSQLDNIKSLHDSVKTGNSFLALLPGNKTPNLLAEKKSGEKAGTKIETLLKNHKAAALKPIKTKGNTSTLSTLDHYGFETGVNMGKGTAPYLGVYGGLSFNSKWQLNAGARITFGIPVSGGYEHPSFYKPDSSAAFKVVDTRKVTAVDIPVNVEYEVSDRLFIKAGPVLRFNIRQHQTGNNISPHNLIDTLFYGQVINDAINKTTINKIGIGLTSGIGLRYKHFDIEGRYQLLSPFKISNDIGKYKMANHSFQLGITYRIK